MCPLWGIGCLNRFPHWCDLIVTHCHIALELHIALVQLSKARTASAWRGNSGRRGSPQYLYGPSNFSGAVTLQGRREPKWDKGMMTDLLFQETLHFGPGHFQCESVAESMARCPFRQARKLFMNSFGASFPSQDGSKAAWQDGGK